MVVNGCIHPNPGPLSCIYTNARSVVNKCKELQTVLSLASPDILAITETWLKAKHSSQEFFGGYVVFRKDRPHRGGGGIALCVKDGIPAHRRTDLENMPHNNGNELLIVEIFTKSGKLFIMLAYRPPNITSQFTENLSCMLDVLYAINPRMGCFIRGI